MEPRNHLITSKQREQEMDGVINGPESRQNVGEHILSIGVLPRSVPDDLSGGRAERARCARTLLDEAVEEMLVSTVLTSGDEPRVFCGT